MLPIIAFWGMILTCSQEGSPIVSYKFLDITSTPSVRAAQAANGSREMWERFKGHRTFDRFTDNEAAFIAARDSFYMATVSESGWPYVQHRGGPPGFLKVLDEKMLGFADFRGNLQYISVGNRRRRRSRRADPCRLSEPRASESPGARGGAQHCCRQRTRRAPVASPAIRASPSEHSCCTWKHSTGIARSTSRRALRSRKLKLRCHRCGPALPSLRPRTRRFARRPPFTPGRVAWCSPSARG